MNKNVLRLCETAIMIALATVLSLLKLLELPYGGSVTAFSMVPIIIIAFRYGNKWGLLSGFVYSLIQLLLGSSNLSYATSAMAAVTIILFDYVFAFSFLGLGGVFRNKINNPAVAATAGAAIGCGIRYICHVISGCTVWAGISIPTADALIYSVSYNATYMIPEAIINIAMVFWLCSCLDFKSGNIRQLKKENGTALTAAMSALSILSIIVTIIIDAVTVFGTLQAEDGSLDITLITNVNITTLGIVSIAGILLCAAFAVIAKYNSSNGKKA